MYCTVSCHWLFVQSFLSHSTPLYLHVINCSSQVVPDWLQTSTFASPPLLLPGSRLVPSPPSPLTRPRTQQLTTHEHFTLSSAASYSRLWLAALTSRRHHKEYLSFVIKFSSSFQRADCKDMTDHLHRAISADQQLKSTGIKPDEELFAGIMLANLPDRFEPLIMALKNCSEKITVDNIRNRLLAEDVKPQVDVS
ncbi:hypothetical protein AVEN_26808-1 [Araneus ventricosus]|uniref:Retrovirus-related Pol polyprotein from transposon TNT 1-94 n=1 Tax=Araneus ventricosus TaxID=182803 RepID=A0A4Y2J0D3_ARAVE|nr:hypothetical protein AVEN_26808-1 [Araneus ventricosus]